MKKLLFPIIAALGLVTTAHADFAPGSLFFDDVSQQTFPDTWVWKDFTLKINWSSKSMVLTSKTNNTTTFSVMNPVVSAGKQGGVVSPNNFNPCLGSFFTGMITTTVTFQFEQGVNVTLNNLGYSYTTPGFDSVYDPSSGSWKQVACSTSHLGVIRTACINGADCQQQ